MATTINEVDFSKVVEDALAAAKAIVANDWDKIRDIVKHVADSVANDVEFISKKKLSQEFNESDAKVFMEDQKMVARIRLRSLAIIGLQLAERIWNAVADVFRAAIKKALNWTVL
jgi:hypothetical protein